VERLPFVNKIDIISEISEIDLTYVNNRDHGEQLRLSNYKLQKVRFNKIVVIRECVRDHMTIL